MEWRESYLDAVLVPLGLMISAVYHVYLWHKVRTHPLSTLFGVNARARRLWIDSIIQDNDKKNILAVQTLRNVIMGSTLMATTSILLSAGLAAVISSTYSVKRPVNDAVFGARGDVIVALKYVTILAFFLFSFFSHSLSIRLINQATFLINVPMFPPTENPPEVSAVLSPEYVSELVEKGFVLNTVGNRLFYTAVPLVMWVFGPVLVFFCSLVMVPVLYNLDFLFLSKFQSGKTEKKQPFRSVCLM